MIRQNDHICCIKIAACLIRQIEKKLSHNIIQYGIYYVCISQSYWTFNLVYEYDPIIKVIK